MDHLPHSIVPVLFLLHCHNYSCEFVTPVLTGGFSLKSGWQKASSDLQDSFKYFIFLTVLLGHSVSLFIIISLIASFLSGVSWWSLLESKWQQVSSDLQDSSRILAELKCCGLDGFDSSIKKNISEKKIKQTTCGTWFGWSGEGRSNPRQCGTKKWLLF